METPRFPNLTASQDIKSFYFIFHHSSFLHTKKKSGLKHSINLETQTFVLVIFIKISQLGVI